MEALELESGEDLLLRGMTFWDGSFYPDMVKNHGGDWAFAFGVLSPITRYLDILSEITCCVKCARNFGA